MFDWEQGVKSFAGRRQQWLAKIACAAILGLWPQPGISETLIGALARVYQSNPLINVERARLRATDETIPQAMAGYRPQVNGTFSAGYQTVTNGLPDGTTQSANLKPWVAGVTLVQPLFNGFGTANSVRQAEAQVRSGRESLRNVEQNVFIDAVTAYMSVVANQALVDSERASLTFLRETLRTTRVRLNAGDVTPTDVAQAEARYNRGLADLNAAEVALAVAQAIYAQVIGVKPGVPEPTEPIDRLLPRSREEALAIGRHDHPRIAAAIFDIDVAVAAIKIAESGFMPNASVQASASRSVETDTTLTTTSTNQASIIGQANVPLYDGGLASSQVRQAKERSAQARIVLDQVRVSVDAVLATAWSTNEGAKTAITAAEAEVKAATIAQRGVQQEQQAGQRTTIDVLNANQDLVAARARLILAQRDRVIASYVLLAAIGHLDQSSLALKVPGYDPQVHYTQVRDVWYGLRTPDGR
jgi:outer membrane protein